MAQGNPADLSVEERDAARLYAISATLTALLDELSKLSPDMKDAVRSKATSIVEMASTHDVTNGAIPAMMGATIDQLFGGVPRSI